MFILSGVRLETKAGGLDFFDSDIILCDSNCIEIFCFREVAVPIYEYRCESCSHKFEAIQKISDPVLKDCPECKKPDLKKLISAAGFRLKGGGWYETDFKSGGKKKNLLSEKSGSESTGSKASSSDNTKKTAS